MLEYDRLACFPSSEELPDSDDTPVDNQLQHLIPTLLEAILAMAWSDRLDWYFGVDMGIYYDPDLPAIVPDGFLSLGVARIIKKSLRRSYPLWEEQKPPILVLEVVSHNYRGEYTDKKIKYASLGILYYLIYNPFRIRKSRLEVYKLIKGEYKIIPGNPVWLPEIGLGIGIEEGTYQGITREWMYWYNADGQRLLTPEEQAKQAQQEAEQAQQRAQVLAERLRSLGIDPDTLI